MYKTTDGEEWGLSLRVLASPFRVVTLLDMNLVDEQSRHHTIMHEDASLASYTFLKVHGMLVRDQRETQYTMRMHRSVLFMILRCVLCKSVCPSVGSSVRRSVDRSVPPWAMLFIEIFVNVLC